MKEYAWDFLIYFNCLFQDIRWIYDYKFLYQNLIKYVFLYFDRNRSKQYIERSLIHSQRKVISKQSSVKLLLLSMYIFRLQIRESSKNNFLKRIEMRWNAARLNLDELFIVKQYWRRWWLLGRTISTFLYWSLFNLIQSLLYQVSVWIIRI